MWESIFVLAVLFIGSFIQGSSGFGFGLFSMGLIPLVLSVKISTLLVLGLTVILSLRILVKFARFILWKDLTWILCAALIGRIIAFFFMEAFGQTQAMKQWLGFILIGMVVYLFIKRNRSNTSVSMANLTSSPLLTFIVGLLGGFLGGAFAVGGPFFVVYFLMKYTDKRHYNANLQVTFLFSNLLTITAHAIHQDLDRTFFAYLLSGLVVVLCGVSLGLRWFERLPKVFIQRAAYIIVLIAGINLLLISYV